MRPHETISRTRTRAKRARTHARLVHDIGILSPKNIGESIVSNGPYGANLQEQEQDQEQDQEQEQEQEQDQEQEQGEKPYLQVY